MWNIKWTGGNRGYHSSSEYTEKDAKKLCNKLKKEGAKNIRVKPPEKD